MSNQKAKKSIAQLIAMTPKEVSRLSPAQKGARTRRINVAPLAEGFKFGHLDNSAAAASMIDAALTQIGAGGKQYEEMAAFIQGMQVPVTDSYTKPVTVLNQISWSFRTLDKARAQSLKAASLIEQAGHGGPAVAVSGLKPEQLFGLVKSLSNKLCWNVRQRIQQVEKEALDLELTKISSMDFTEDSAEDCGIDCTETIQELIVTVEAAGRYIRKLYSAMTRAVSGYMVPNPYALYTEDEYVPPADGEQYGEMVVTFQSDSFDEIAPMLETALARMQEQKEIESDAEMGMVDFMDDSEEEEEEEAMAPRQESAA